MSVLVAGFIALAGVGLSALAVATWGQVLDDWRATLMGNWLRLAAVLVAIALTSVWAWAAFVLFVSEAV